MTLKKLIFIFSIFCLIIMASINVLEKKRNASLVCEDHKVTELISFHHRTATVKIDNNKIIEINQPKPAIKIGSIHQICRLNSTT